MQRENHLPKVSSMTLALSGWFVYVATQVQLPAIAGVIEEMYSSCDCFVGMGSVQISGRVPALQHIDSKDIIDV